MVSGIFFGYDKIAAVRSFKRVPEYLLHFLELIGGVFVNIILMYLIHHKNRKFKYYIVTYLILLLWIVFLLMIRFEIYHFINL